MLFLCATLGEKRLKDLIRPEHIHQLVIPNLPADFPPLKTLDVFQNNLPIQLTSFIGSGKTRSRSSIQELHDHVLVTLTGSGGTGKTRLSLQVAAGELDKYLDGVWFVELAPVTDPALVPTTMANLLGLRGRIRRDKTIPQPVDLRLPAVAQSAAGLRQL